MGTRLVLAEKLTGDQADGQLWTLTADGYLRHKQTGMVADIFQSLTAPGTPVIAWVINNPRSANQEWTLTADGHLRSQLEGMVMEVAGPPVPGAVVESAVSGQSQAQVWHLVRDVPPVRVVTGRALSLDGTDQMVEIPAPQFGTADLTLEAWVRTTVGGPVFATTGFRAGEGMVFSVETDGSLLFALADIDRDPVMVVCTEPTDVLDGEWHHVAAVRQGTTGLIYLDGVVAPTPSRGSRLVVPFEPVWLQDQTALLLGQAVRPPVLVDERTPARAFQLSRYQFVGDLDEVRVWGQARTPEAIAAGLHHLESDTDPDLLGRWSFDAGDAADSTPAGRHGTLRGVPSFADSEVELVAPGESYLVTQAKLTQDWVSDPTQQTGMRELTGYRVVVSAHGPDDAPLPSYLTVWSADPVTLHFADGTSAELGGEATCTRLTDGRGVLTFTIDANGSLTCPALRVRSDFMDIDQRVVVYPDRHAHAALATVTGNTLLGRDDSGAPLPSVAKNRRPSPIPADTDPAAADAVAQAVAHVMSTAVGHDVQADRPLTRSRSLPEDLPTPRPYLPRYQDTGLVAGGFDPASDAIATHFLDTDQPVVRVLVAENAPAPHWTYDHVGRAFRTMSDHDVATALAGLDVRHLDDYTSTFQLDPDVFTGRRTITLRSDELLSSAEGQLSRRWFGGDFLSAVEDAASVIVTTVETVVTDVVTRVEEVVKTIVVTVVTEIRDAVTGLVQAFDAALQTVEDAVDFVAAVLRKVGAEIARVVEFLRDLFEWDDILVAQQVMEKYLVESRSIIGQRLHGAGDRAVKAVEAFRTSLDTNITAWRAGIGADTVSQRSTAARTAPPQNVQSGYLTSMLGQNLGASGVGATLQDEFGALVGALHDELSTASATFLHRAPDLIDTSGFTGAFSDANTLFGAGLDVLLQAVQAVADLALEMTEDVLRAILALLDKLLDALYKIATTRLDIPIVTPFYEQVVMRGNGGQLTLFSLLALLAAIPMTVTYKALTRSDEPVFSIADRDAFLAMDASAYTWISDPFAPKSMLTPRTATLPISDHAIQALNWAGGFLYTASTNVWGLAATASDVLWVATVVTAGSSASLFGEPAPTQPKFEKPLCYVVLGSQLACLVTGYPWSTDFGSTPDAIAFGLWAAQAVPLVSNLVASTVDGWGKIGDPALTGAYGVVCMGLMAWLWWERDHAPGADRAADAAEGMGNLFGNLTWCVQLIKLSPTQSFYTIVALLLLDFVGYAGLAVTTFARTITDMAAKLPWR